MSNLTGKKIKDSYPQFLITEADGGLSGSLTGVWDGDGTVSKLQLSTAAVNVISGFQLAGTAVTSTATELNYLDLTASIGDATASKAVVLDANKDFDFGTGDVTCTNLTVSGTLSATLSLTSLSLTGDLTIGSDGTGNLIGPNGADFNIRSDGEMNFYIDYDTGETGQSFNFYNHTSTLVAELTEGGDLQLDGDLDIDGGGIDLTTADTVVSLNDNSATALSFDASGDTGIIVLDSRNSAQGVTMSGYLTVAGLITASGNVSIVDTVSMATGKKIQWVDSSTYIKGTTSDIEIDGDGVVKLVGGTKVYLDTLLLQLGKSGETTDIDLSAGDDVDVTLPDNKADAWSFDSSGKTGILVVKTTNSSEGVTMSGTLAVDGAVTIDNGSTIGSDSTPAAITIASDGDLTFSDDLTVTGNTTLNGTHVGGLVTITSAMTGYNVADDYIFKLNAAGGSFNVNDLAGGVTGQILHFVTADPGVYQITIKDLSGSNQQIRTNDGNDIILTEEGQGLSLIFNGSYWVELYKQPVSSATATITASGPTDNFDVTTANVVFMDTSSNNVTLGGFTGGVAGQVVQVVITDVSNNGVVEHNEGHAYQKIYLNGKADTTLTTQYGGWTLVCNGSHWFEVDRKST